WSVVAPDEKRMTLIQSDPTQFHSFCDMVVIVDAARRGKLGLRPVSEASTAALKRAWPILELRTPPRNQQIVPLLAAQCGVYEAQLARRPVEFALALDRASHLRPPERRRLLPQILPLRGRRQIPA
ncbi:MAG: hypothetical protein NZ561_02300, partial [Phycisphaerae bacterium]|nr:hypothetical protein [Phycisphaerae bacterium]MDW8263142.1 hypothetical protein [Phycisphaerales bacterium]